MSELLDAQSAVAAVLTPTRNGSILPSIFFCFVFTWCVAIRITRAHPSPPSQFTAWVAHIRFVNICRFKNSRCGSRCCGGRGGCCRGGCCRGGGRGCSGGRGR